MKLSITLTASGNFNIGHAGTGYIASYKENTRANKSGGVLPLFRKDVQDKKTKGI
jgi:hypothetical protein